MKMMLSLAAAAVVAISLSACSSTGPYSDGGYQATTTETVYNRTLNK